VTIPAFVAAYDQLTAGLAEQRGMAMLLAQRGHTELAEELRRESIEALEAMLEHLERCDPSLAECVPLPIEAEDEVRDWFDDHGWPDEYDDDTEGEQ
jgi:hypothetical protein